MMHTREIFTRKSDGRKIQEVVARAFRERRIQELFTNAYKGQGSAGHGLLDWVVGVVGGCWI